MRLKVSFDASPSIFVKIEMAKSAEDEFSTIFCNSGTIEICEGLEISGNTLKFTNSFATAEPSISTSFVLKITNLMTENYLKAKASGTGATSNPTYVTMKESGSGEDTATMTISGNSALSTLQLSFSEYTEYAVGVSPSSGNFTYTANPVAISGENYTANIKAKAGYNLSITVTRDDGTTTLKQDTDYTWDSSTGALIIYASAVTGDITINCLNDNVISYAISYTLNGGSVATANPNPTAYTVEDTFTLTNPTKTGYNFAGWTGTGLNGAIQSVTISQMTGDRSYTATWTVVEYTISYTLNGGTNNPNNPAKYTIESANITLQAPTRRGYTFTGWTGSNGTTAQTSVTIAKGSTGHKSYTANWSVNSYTVTYNLTNCTSNKTSGASVNYDTSYSATLTPSITGYAFARFNVTNISSGGYTWDSSTGVFTITDWAKVNGNITVTAVAALYMVYQYGTTGAVDANRAYYSSTLHYKYYIEMGEYPQTGADSTTEDYLASNYASLSTDAKGYYTYSAKYARVGRNFYKVEPIRWIVLGGVTNTTNGSSAVAFNPTNNVTYNSTNKTFTYNGTSYSKVLLIAEQALINNMYDSSSSDQPWQDTDIYKFLNTTLMPTIFNGTQQNKILGTTLYTARYSVGGDNNILPNTPNGTSTNNKLFLLAVGGAFGYTTYDTENYKVGTYFIDTTAGYGGTSVANVTDYARANGAYWSANYKSTEWWLRSGHPYGSNYAHCVFDMGSSAGNNSVYRNQYAVRPCFILNLA